VDDLTFREKGWIVECVGDDRSKGSRIIRRLSKLVVVFRA